jgi:hypothetical protein
MLTLTEYAARHDKSTRTVQRWLDRGALPGAVMVEGRWAIPADVLPLRDAAGTVATTGAPAGVAPPATLAGALDTLPAYLTIERAAQLLGISPYAVRTHIARFCGERVGPAGAWMVPASVVRQVAGL